MLAISLTLLLIAFRHFIGPAALYHHFYVADKDQWTADRIQSRSPSEASIVWDKKQTLRSILTDGLMVAIVLALVSSGAVEFSYTMSTDQILPSIFAFVALLFAQDLYFYVTHYALHLPPLYRRVHALHHRSTNPTPWTSFSVHFVEGFTELMFYPLVFMLFKLNVYVVLLYVFVTTAINLFGHAGFRLEKFALGRVPGFSWVALCAFHNRHHQSFTGNYSLYFRIWDKVFGTEFK